MDCPPPAAAPRPPAGDHAGRALRHQPPFSTRQFRGAQAWCDTHSWKPPEPPPCSPPSLPALLQGSRARPRAARASASACATPSPARGLCPRSQGCFGPRDPVWVLLASGLSLPPAVCGLPAAPTRAPPFPRSASAPGSRALRSAALRAPAAASRSPALRVRVTSSSVAPAGPVQSQGWKVCLDAPRTPERGLRPGLRP